MTFLATLQTLGALRLLMTFVATLQTVGELTPLVPSAKREHPGNCDIPHVDMCKHMLTCGDII